MNDKRLNDFVRFYSILDTLERNIGGAKTFADCSGRMDWPKRGEIGMLPDSTDEEILFFGEKDYVPLFCKLTQNVKGKWKVFHSAAQGPAAPAACW